MILVVFHVQLANLSQPLQAQQYITKCYRIRPLSCK